ncbi:hypothetical protein [Paenibacillus sp. WLX2291]|uniref:hypothetical protein n=1 Tax=Paenibacillus sp. WLX2291 TaxID=3296934 RepID=UPI003984118D
MNGKLRTAIAGIPVEQYAVQGSLPLCLSDGASPALDKLKPLADEVWSDGQHEVLTFHYAGHAVHMTFQSSGTYLFDSMDIWADMSDCGEIGIGAPEGLSLLATRMSLEMDIFELPDEMICLLPNAVTVHYRKHNQQWMLTKIAGAYRNYEDTRSSLHVIANAG